MVVVVVMVVLAVVLVLVLVVVAEMVLVVVGYWWWRSGCAGSGNSLFKGGICDSAIVEVEVVVVVMV